MRRIIWIGLLLALTASSAHGAAAKVSVDVSPRVASVLDLRNVFGGIGALQAGQRVVVERKECGTPGYVAVNHVTTDRVGRWQIEMRVYKNSVFRARWRGTVSPTVEVKSRPEVALFRRGQRFEIEVKAWDVFGGKRIVFERLDADSRRWVRVRTVVLQRGTPSPSLARSVAIFSADAPRGALVRAVLPRSQVGACYLAGYSNVIRA